jgi:hypothetical protein
MGAITSEERASIRARSPIGTTYDTPVNRESAYEILTRRTSEKAAADAMVKRRETKDSDSARGKLGDVLWGTDRREGMLQAMAKQAARTVGSQIGRQILRGILGGILGGSGRK